MMSNSSLYRLCGKRDEIIDLIHYLSEKRMKLIHQIAKLTNEVEEDEMS